VWRAGRGRRGGPGAGRARRGRGGPGEVRARRARRRRPTPAARPRSAGQNSRGSRGRPIPRRSSRDGGDGDVHDRATVMFAKRARQYDVRRACYMTTTSVRCTPTLESISRMIHCEDVSVKFARRVEAILADPEILEAPSALHLAAFYGGYAFAVPGVGWIPGAVDAHVGVSGNSMRSWHHVYMRLRGRDGLVQVAKAILAVVLNGPRDPEASQGTLVSQSPPEHVVRTLGQAWRLQRVGMYLGELTLDWLYNFMLGARAADEDCFPVSSATKVDPLGASKTDPAQVFSGWSWLSRGARLVSSA
jgi:hypothetical protein